MSAKRGYFIYDNGLCKLFFLECDEINFAKALSKKDITKICEIACMEHTPNGLFIKSNWYHVRSEMDLIAQIKRMRLGDE